MIFKRVKAVEEMLDKLLICIPRLYNLMMDARQNHPCEGFKQEFCSKCDNRQCMNNPDSTFEVSAEDMMKNFIKDTYGSDVRQSTFLIDRNTPVIVTKGGDNVDQIIQATKELLIKQLELLNQEPSEEIRQNITVLLEVLKVTQISQPFADFLSK